MYKNDAYYFKIRIPTAHKCLRVASASFKNLEKHFGFYLKCGAYFQIFAFPSAATELTLLLTQLNPVYKTSERYYSPTLRQEDYSFRELPTRLPTVQICDTLSSTLLFQKPSKCLASAGVGSSPSSCSCGWPSWPTSSSASPPAPRRPRPHSRPSSTSPRSAARS